MRMSLRFLAQARHVSTPGARQGHYYRWWSYLEAHCIHFEYDPNNDIIIVDGQVGSPGMPFLNRRAAKSAMVVLQCFVERN